MQERHVPSFEYPSSELPETRFEQAPLDQDQGGEQEGNQAASAELTSKERDTKEKLVQEIAQGLATLYERLPRQGEVTAETVKGLIDQTNLVELSPLMKNSLSGVVERHELHQKSKEDFIKVGLGVLDLWIHSHALGLAATERLERLRSSMASGPDVHSDVQPSETP